MTSTRVFMSAALLFAITPKPSAAVLIEINVSNPSAVTFQATGNPAAINDSSTTTLLGVTLLSFYREVITQVSPESISGDLTPSGATAAYGLYYVDNHSGSFKDLNLLRETPLFDKQAFSTAVAAFTGTATIDFSSFPVSALPTIGTTGNLLAGFSGDFGGVIGQWTVVPEVSSAVQAGVMGAVLLGWLTWRRCSSGR